MELAKIESTNEETRVQIQVLTPKFMHLPTFAIFQENYNLLNLITNFPMDLRSKDNTSHL